MTKRWNVATAACVLLVTLTPASRAEAQALASPEGWKTSAERFVAMPPGFHITTTGSVLLYNPDASAWGEFALESNGFLFPGETDGTYGVFIGGRDLDTDDATWTSFEIGLDGNWVIRNRTLREEGGAVIENLIGPQSGAVVVPEGAGPTENLFRIEVGAEAIVFMLNGERVAELPRADVSTDGVTGFRVGSDINLHLTTFDIVSGESVRSFAPAREEDQ